MATFKINYTISSVPSSINVQETHKMTDVLQRIASINGLNAQSLNILYGGHFYNYSSLNNITVINFANQADKSSKIMSIIIRQSYATVAHNNTPNNFVQNNYPQNVQFNSFAIQNRPPMMNFNNSASNFAPMIIVNNNVPPSGQMMNFNNNYNQNVGPNMRINIQIKEMAPIFNDYNINDDKDDNDNDNPLLEDNKGDNQDNNQDDIQLDNQPVVNVQPPPVIPMNEQTKFYLINFIILISQFIPMTLFIFFGFEPSKDILVKIKVHLAIKLIPILFAMLVMSFIFHIFLKKYKNHKCMIIFYILYPFIIIYYCLLFSDKMEIKYFQMGISLLTLEILSMGILLIFRKKYTLLFFSLSSVVLSLIGLLLFIFLWMEELMPRIYISIFWFVTNAIFILKILAIQKICINCELYYSVAFFDYGIFLGFAYLITELIKFTHKKAKVKYNLLSNDSLFKTYIILLGQYAAILLFAGIGIALGVGKLMKNDGTYGILDVVVMFNYIILAVIGVAVGYFYYTKRPMEGNAWYSCHIAYIINITIVSYHFSSFLKAGIAMGTLAGIFLIIAVNTIAILITNKDTTLRVLIISIIMGIITYGLNYLIFREFLALLINFFFLGATVVVLPTVTYLIKREQETYECDTKYCVICFDYLLFSLIAIIGIILMICGLAIAGGTARN